MLSTKKLDKNKQTRLPRTVDYSKRFLKDWERLSRTGRYNMRHLKEAMLTLLANDEPLAPEWLDHALNGDWADHRECHIGGDFLLIYQIEATSITLVRAGTHAELFD
ncbi:type II toxin-antitoxin system YafQ family toxin [Phyllobacterium endophyticum]|uniref:Type II toxin-antitoxin system YafQ family toxin n=1 Tax=Phyllobacterium endophyticum TaxID=1149773 RepID=A0A2P7AV05_9HYPH|nr:type II toxin-antitoxin system YafQ family toxin [Phyllobacterium endophyticum]MBB3234572.1 mRNA interferase YafQ [Phyllobacterium endophyticum]PSH58049.1 type II toxin-antitoxin system YafQ family toxin [Phyllobacterium endophyticum]TYR38720.1 type II toxin-antitoxin system YafQ family toxin [Phyllobacterium endophyticum]